MKESIDDLIAKIHQLEERMEEELLLSRERFHVILKGRIAEFAEEVVLRQKEFKVRFPQFIRAAKIRNILVAPVIYSLIIPVVIVDFWVTLYQWVCFPAYGIPLVKRRTYVIIDHHHLAYLNTVEKFNCVYCGYANGVFAYIREVASRTEQFWCPIKHALRVRDPHERYLKFVEYGDAQGYRAKLAELRKNVQE